MIHRTALLLSVVLGLCVGANAEPMSSADEYLELLEIEIVEAVCGDSTFRYEISASWDRCTKKALSGVPVCTKALHQFAPRDDVVNDPKRLEKNAFVLKYSDCLKSELRK